MNAVLRCEDVDALDAAYALGALDSDETRAVRDHLRTCANPHTALRELASVATVVSMTLEPIEPSTALRGRLMATVARTPQELPASGPAPEPRRVAVPVEERENRWFSWLSPRLATGLAAAALAGVVALGAWNVALQGALGERDRALQATADALEAGGTAYRVEGDAGRGYLVESANGSGSLIVTDLDDLASGERYQMWLLADDVPVTAGSFTPGEADLVVVPLDRPIGDYGTFAVTVEERPVDAPTSEPIMVAELTN